LKALANVLRRYRAPIQIGFGIVAVACLVWAVAANWRDLVHAIGSMDPALIVAAVALAYLGTIANMLSWRSIVESFQVQVRPADAGRITFTAQIGKYIPGGVWPMVAGSQLGQRIGLAGATTVVTMTLQLTISLLTGCVLAVGSLFLVPELAGEYWWLIVLVLIAGAIALVPPVMQRLLERVFRLIRRPDLLPALHGKHLGRAILWALAAWILFGLQLWLLFCALGTVEWRILIPAICGYALSWVVGFLAIFAPAGAGVREGILVLLFADTFGGSSVLGVALVSRMAFILVDLTLFLWAAGGLRRHRITTPDGRGSEAE
jgi:uncharacterized membrane protein YbhN (UPF0104 family)